MSRRYPENPAISLVLGAGSILFLFTGLGWYWEKLCLSVLVFCSLWEGHLEWFHRGSQSLFLILEEQELHYIFVKKSIFFTWAQYVVWTYKIKFNNLASLWVYFSVSLNFFLKSGTFFLPPVCIALAVPPLSFLSNGFLFHFSTFWIHQKNVKTWGE